MWQENGPRLHLLMQVSSVWGRVWLNQAGCTQIVKVCIIGMMSELGETIYMLCCSNHHLTTALASSLAETESVLKQTNNSKPVMSSDVQ